MKLRGAGMKAGAAVLVAMLAAGLALLPMVGVAANGDSYYGEARLKAVGAQSSAITDAAAATAAAFTDSTTGTASQTLAAGAGVFTLSIPIALAQITGAGDVLTTYTPGFAFKILSVDARVTKVVTTADDLATLNLEIGTTNVTGGAVALTSATCTPLGVGIAGSAVTAANTGTSTDTISVEAASVTAFAEGEIVLLVKVQNMDTANAFASLADDSNKLVTDVGLVRTCVNACVAALERAWLVAD